ncbi:MAG TPA: hypothetical protein VHD33_08415, partial [Legionellaceae bacterium]|nr:hypothetical protein [Legionellaceae bacterium]
MSKVKVGNKTVYYRPKIGHGAVLKKLEGQVARDAQQYVNDGTLLQKIDWLENKCKEDMQKLSKLSSSSPEYKRIKKELTGNVIILKNYKDVAKKENLIASSSNDKSKSKKENENKFSLFSFIASAAIAIAEKAIAFYIGAGSKLMSAISKTPDSPTQQIKNTAPKPEPQSGSQSSLQHQEVNEDETSTTNTFGPQFKPKNKD